MQKTSKRCPNNTRMNRKTGLCEPLRDVNKNANMRRRKTKRTSILPSKVEMPVATPIVISEEKSPTPQRPLEVREMDSTKTELVTSISSETLDEDSMKDLPVVEKSTVLEPNEIPQNIHKKRCKNGTRRNKTTGLCDPIQLKSPRKYKKNALVIEEPVSEEGPVNDVTEEDSEQNVSQGPEESNESVKEVTEEDSQKTVSEVLKEDSKESVKESSEGSKEPSEMEYINPTEHFSDPAKNTYLFNQEKKEFYEELKTPDTEFSFLYPSLNDPQFSSKIASIKEFSDYKYEGTYYDEVKKIKNNIEEYAERLCNVPFELSSHQLFVKNFLSFQTPYNSLLLYHGLGSGKTCSAIGIAEETRLYMKQIGIKNRILVIASPNVQSNFKLQLFDERKLQKISSSNSSSENIWNINSCIGNSLLKEINPANLKGLAREKIISQINTIINTYYAFMGYGQFANYITNKIKINENENYTEKEKTALTIKKIKQHFNNRLIIIDEVHNIRLTDENNNKKTAALLMKVAKYSENMRLLLLSATPMYNSYKEIIWLSNLMNMNDKRSIIDVNDVFNKDGEYLVSKKSDDPMKEGGEDLLRRKLTGYISYVRGENPFVFPFRIYPKYFAPKKTFESLKYPTLQMNGKPIDEPIKHLQLYVNTTGHYQMSVYKIIIENLRKRSYNNYNTYGDMREMPSFENMESFGYTLLQTPLEALNIVYPNKELDKYVKKLRESDFPSPESDSINEESIAKENSVISNSVGTKGLLNIIKWEETTKPAPLRFNFEYKKGVEHIFNREHLHKYSSKINTICESIMKSTGIVLIYSQYIDGGVIPIALALEEMGLERYCSNSLHNSLFKKPPCKSIDALQLKPRSELSDDHEFIPAKYIMISGDKSISPSNAADLKYATSIDNKYGERVKVIIISKAGSEGLDFKFIRQIHILEPWYNMNRIEQIIGRGVRNLSHCGLPFKERNVELYLHSTLLERNDEEAADLYVYRLAEKKALQIGRVTRLLKEMSVDCVLNVKQTMFSAETILEIVQDNVVQIKTSSERTNLPFTIGDQPFTDICDYMDNCEYKCSRYNQALVNKPNKTSYNIDLIKINNERIVQRIKDLFREHSFYERQVLINSINVLKTYPIEDIYYALSFLIKNKNEYLIDKNGRLGNLINKDKYYVFQPLEMNDVNASLFERTVPVEYKREHLNFEVPKEIKETLPVTQKKGKPGKPEKLDNPPYTDVVFDENQNPIGSPNGNEQDLDAVSEETLNESVLQILSQIKTNLDYVFSSKYIAIHSGEKSWYKHANHVLEDMETMYGITRVQMEKYILDHAFDLLMFSDKIRLIQYIYTTPMNAIDDKEYVKILGYAKRYFDKNNIIVEKDVVGFVLFKDNGWKLFVISSPDEDDGDVIEESREHGPLREADPEEYNIFKRQLEEFKIDYSKLNVLIGFVNMFRNREMVFKVKDLRQTRNNIGARCGDSTTRADAIKLLNTLLEKNEYTNKTDIRMISFCVIIETLMRYYTDIGKNGKLYYVSPEKTVFNDIVHYSKV